MMMMMMPTEASMSSRRRHQQRAQPMSLLSFIMPRMLFRFLLILLLLLAALPPAFCSDTPSSPPPSPSSLILRVRLPDGSMQRVSVPSDQATLKDVVESLSEDACWDECEDDDDKESMPMVEVDGKYVPMSTRDDDNNKNEYTVRTVRDWGLRQGSILTIIPSAAERKKTLTSLPPPSFGTEQQQQQKQHRWDPFPDLATDYPAALLKTKRRRARGASLSYADLAQLQASMHLVEAQPTGPITRVYMCAISAERFQIQSAGANNMNRVGLLLGTVQRERTNPRKNKARTSLSSTTEAEEYCQVVKVHAIWEPPIPSSALATTATAQQPYDATPLFNVYKQEKNEETQVLRVAQWLGLQPVGWIYSYNDNRMKHHDNGGTPTTGSTSNTSEDALPVWIRDVITGAKLQIYNMQSSSSAFGGRINGSRFATLAMHVQTGATEAFQLSDVAVQMVAEDMLLLDNNADDDDVNQDDDKKEKDSKKKNKKKNKDSAGVGGGRFGSTKHPIIVDGKETQTLDSVLCLVNTAMLSHQGSFAGAKATSAAVKKSNGRLTTKTRKALLKALDGKDYASLFGILSNFQVLLAIDESLLQANNVKASEQLVTIVRKWARGQKQGTVLDAKLEKTLRALLDH